MDKLRKYFKWIQLFKPFYFLEHLSHESNHLRVKPTFTFLMFCLQTLRNGYKHELLMLNFVKFGMMQYPLCRQHIASQIWGNNQGRQKDLLRYLFLLNLPGWNLRLAGKEIKIISHFLKFLQIYVKYYNFRYLNL